MTDVAPSPRRRIAWAPVLCLIPALFLILVFLLGPLGYMLPFSLAPGGSRTGDFSQGVTLENYAQILGDYYYFRIILRTVVISLAITTVALIVGWPLAYFLWKANPRYRTLMTVAVIAPLLVSIPVRNYGWMVIIGDNGLINGWLMTLGLIEQPIRMMFSEFAVVLGLSHVLMPFVVLSVLAALDRIPPNLDEAATTLGSDRARVIWHVVLPLSMPGVIAGATLVFCVALSAYVTPALMGPSGANYSTTLVYQQFTSAFNWPRGAAIGVILLLISLAAVTLLIGFVNKRYKHLMKD